MDGVSGATLTSNAIKDAAASCIAQAKGEAVASTGEETASSTSDDWLGEAPDITDADCSETLECEVLVIGCGIAGVAAVRAAAEEGAQVIAIEKADSPQCRSGEYAVINGKVQANWGRDTWTKEQISAICDFHVQESNYKVKRAIMSKWANNIGDVFDWWVEPNTSLYIAPETRSAIPDENADNFLIPIFYPLPEAYDWTEEQFPCYPTSVEFKPDQSVNLNANMDAAVATGNVDAHYGCFAEKLIMEDGACVGAYIRDANAGTYFRVNASKGVILATGDYSQNEAMVQHFCPDVIENGITRMFTNVDVEGNFTNMGDGIKLGMWAGAQVQQAHAPTIHHMGGGADLSGVGVMGIAGFLNLDMNGKRFMNEDLPGQQVENQIEIQKERKSWQIFDANWPEQLPYMPAEHGGACYYEDYASEDEAPANNTTYRNYKSPYQLQEAIEDGRCVTADTLEGLVALMYPDDEDAQETALTSIQRYNELAEEGFDEDFGKVSRRMWALENPPYYADQFETALLLVICGGLESDEDCHTFDENRDIIPGLYVAGNIQGSRFVAEYPITLKGVSHSMAMYYGYVAGKNVAAL
ncbi:MAG: FAD-dependent oxidoreductase [Clostridiales bacterium]|nr:FAD-dependent oxidoreductase [Clostridiales bacterium]